MKRKRGTTSVELMTWTADAVIKHGTENQNGAVVRAVEICYMYYFVLFQT